MIHFNLPVTALHIELRATQAIQLPAFAGSKLEGAFGHALYAISCTRRDLETCHPCPLRGVCPFARLYVPELPEQLSVASLENPPRPLVFRTGLQREHSVRPGESFSFGLRVIGQAVQHLPYIVAAIRQMGEHGLGLTRGQFELLEVQSQHPYTQQHLTLSRGDDPVMHLEPITINQNDLPPMPTGPVRLQFATFVHLKNAGRVVDALHFPILVRALQRRVSNLEQIYGAGNSVGGNYAELPQLARGIDILEQRMEFVAQRRSGKGRAPVIMNGLAGSVTFEGNLEPFTTLLRYGELVGVGKWAHFGAGRYRIESVKEKP